MNNTPRAIVAGHGDFAEGVISALQQITGRSDVFIGMSNRLLSGSGVELELTALVQRTGVRVIFTDLPAGSCAMAARRLQRRSPDIALALGANLGALLDFAVRDDMDPVVAAREAIAKGSSTMQFIAPGDTHGP